MRILFLPNWTVHQLNTETDQWQAPDKEVKGRPYWFFRYFPSDTLVDVLDIRPHNILAKIEHKVKFYIYQGFLAYWKVKNYDIVISHGVQSGVMLALLRRLFGTKGIKHVIFDIGGMNGGRTKGLSTRLIQFAMRSNPYIICHSTNIISNFKCAYPWLVDRTKFIPFGVGLYQYRINKNLKLSKTIFVFSGYKRDEDAVAKAWGRIVENHLDQGYTLKFIGTRQVHQAPHSECIRRLPYQQYTEVLESSAFVILPLKEYKYSYGQMSLLGSLALGKYVITTNVSGISDYTAKCKSVLVVNPSDVLEMCHAISQFIQNQVISKDRAVPRKDVEKNFTERQMGKQIYKFMQKILGLAS